MSKLPSVEEMMKAGMHFGHRVSRWHPKMKQYIFDSRKGVYVINLEKSHEKLAEATAFMEQLVSEGKQILFVGTKNQVKIPMRALAEKINMPYVVGKWLGGYLTNFPVIRRSIKKYQDFLSQQETGKLEKYTKKERLDIEREMVKLEERVGGLLNLPKLPDALFVWDIKVEKTAVAEATKKHIPIIAICDTNVNPESVQYPIPANDDSSKTVNLILESIGESILAVQTKK